MLARLLCLVLALAVAAFAGRDYVYTNTPVIGVLTQFISTPDDSFPNRQYLASSYVKWIESAGGRVVPVPMNLPHDRAFELLTQLNGLVMPGGGTYISKEVEDMLAIIVSLNQKGIHFPVWATCMGFQWMSMYFSQLPRDKVLSATNSYNVTYSLDFAHDAKNTSFIKSMPAGIYDILADRTQSVTLNNHHWGVSIDTFTESALSSEFDLISTNFDQDGKMFVSTMQHKKFPFFGTQWHPEKNAYELGMNPDGSMYEVTKHTPEAILASQYCINFFVNECRYNGQSFKSGKNLAAQLIYNYNPTLSGRDFIQRYYFDTFVY